VIVIEAIHAVDQALKEIARITNGETKLEKDVKSVD
jgi:hypothetical protein